ncbi:MAG: hypothetical protein M3305_14430, partial [Actinomycetota bacterium]|nr:hypothetical protein [Actinomycetota bacterium]
MRKFAPLLAIVALALLLACAVSVLGAEKSARAGAFPGVNGKIAFTSNRDGNDEIYTMNPSGKGLRQLTDTLSPSANESPAVSPDGTRIVFE